MEVPRYNTYLKDIFYYAENAQYQTQSYWQWIKPSKETVEKVLFVTVELGKAALHVLAAVIECNANRIDVNINIEREKRKQVGEENEKEEIKKKIKEERQEQNTRIFVAIVSALGVIGLSHIISKDAAKVKEARELEAEVKELDDHQSEWKIENYKDNKAFIKDAKKLFRKVQKNTTNLKIIPNIVTLAGCVFALIGAVYNLSDFMKGGVLIVLTGIAIKIVVNNLYSKADQKVYVLAEKVCNAVRQHITNPTPSAPTKF